ncbi:MAG: VanZ family protein [Syntrophobacteraceae bacterium]|nr:VanZ family protein [Syntrophobacteraceae bacterium]
MPARTLRSIRVLRRLVEMSPWFWVSAIFGAQTFGAILVTLCFKVKAGETWLSIAILAFGAAVSAALGYKDRRRGMARSLCWLPLLVYSLFITSLSKQTFSGAELAFKADYFHLVEFFTLALFLSCLWEPVLGRGRTMLFFIGVVLSGVLWGVADELHQSYVPGRDSSPWDVLYDAAGLSLGCGFYLVARRCHAVLAAWLRDRDSRDAVPVDGVSEGEPVPSPPNA